MMSPDKKIGGSNRIQHSSMFTPFYIVTKPHFYCHQKQTDKWVGALVVAVAYRLHTD